jgi:outer membrane protein, adhesin transport system
MVHKWSAVYSSVALLVLSAGAVAQVDDPLRTAVERSVANNPEISARFNAYRASFDAVAAARAAFRPRIDMNASVGNDSDRITSRSPASQSLSRTGVGVTLTQLLWDGLSTSNDVTRLGHDQLARYFELVDTTEQVVLETTRAHYDVQRFRRLVALAEDNYVQHRYAFVQIQSRFKAGVGRGVDLEQAGARLALAESNLTTEVANLHDVVARYQRIVGDVPPRTLPGVAALKRSAPTSSADAMVAAVRQNAAISASIENLRAARALSEVRRAPFQPRVEARLRAQGGHNVDGVRDQTRDSAAEVVLNWNLYSGGADQARVRQQVNLVNQAADQRDKACRDALQTAAIAFNDIQKLNEQLVLLDRNALAIEKARDAYRQQFDIGQRSLLDVLNAENELYTAKRAYANAEHDLALAYARTHAAMNQLGAQLGVSRPETSAGDAAAWAQGEDAPARCAVSPIAVMTTDRSELDARAQGIAANAPGAAPARKP